MLIDILNCYNSLESMKYGYDIFLNMKLSLANQTQNLEFDFVDLREPAYIGYYNYYHSNPGLIPQIIEERQFIEKTVEKL